MKRRYSVRSTDSFIQPLTRQNKTVDEAAVRLMHPYIALECGGVCHVTLIDCAWRIVFCWVVEGWRSSWTIGTAPDAVKDGAWMKDEWLY